MSAALCTVVKSARYSHLEEGARRQLHFPAIQSVWDDPIELALVLRRAGVHLLERPDRARLAFALERHDREVIGWTHDPQIYGSSAYQLRRQ